MKLRNKETGMIGEVGYIASSTGCILVNNIDDQDEQYQYTSLAELNEEWEDFEERTCWFIDEDGEISSKELGWFNQAQDDIGNRFDTEEETELAVRNLKAWKRLRDAGFEFSGWETSTGKAGGVVETKFNLWGHLTPEITADLDLCFGGKDEL